MKLFDCHSGVQDPSEGHERKARALRRSFRPRLETCSEPPTQTYQRVQGGWLLQGVLPGARVKETVISSPCTVSPLHTNLQVVNFQRCQQVPVWQLSYCTTILFNALYLKIKTFIFCFFLMYYLCEKYYKPITVQCYIAHCVSWVPRLTLLDL